MSKTAEWHSLRKWSYSYCTSKNAGYLGASCNNSGVKGLKGYKQSYNEKKTTKGVKKNKNYCLIVALNHLLPLKVLHPPPSTAPADTTKTDDPPARSRPPSP